MFLLEKRLTAATQFDASVPVATFLENVDGTTLAPGIVPRLLGYSYASLGAAHTVDLYLATAVADTAEAQISLQTPASAVNAFSHLCGSGGSVIPRRYGLQNNGTSGQAIATALGTINNTAPMILMFTTTGKDNTAVLRVWYDYITLGGLH